MKKLLFFAMAAAGMLTACSNNDNLDATTNNGLSELSQEKIQLGVSTNASVTTRGTGTVGGIEIADNVWAGQDLWVYMLNKGSMSVAKYVDPAGIGKDIYNNMKFIAPTVDDATDNGVAATANGFIGYYPVNGASDFWGYRVDDAATMENGQPKIKLLNAEGEEVSAEEAQKRVVDVTIDGTQDIMVGKAELSDEDMQKVSNRPADFYSAYSARKGVQPNIAFEHLLTRFTFKVKAGNKATAGENENAKAVSVIGISVDSKTKGQLTVAYTGEKPATLLEFGEQDAKALKLCERTSDDHNALLDTISVDNNNTVALEWDNEGDSAKVLSIGEALLVAPGESEYPLTIDLAQVVDTAMVEGAPKTDNKSLQQKATLKLNGTEFKAGQSYEVVITVYGLEKIQVSATLKPWVKAGTIEIDDDQDPSTVFKPATPGEGE